MIKIRICKHIYRQCETHELGSWASLKMKLPYAPYPGLIIHDGKGEVLEILRVKYDNSDKITYCYVESEWHTDYADAKKHALELGWELKEVPSGKICEDPITLF